MSCFWRFASVNLVGWESDIQGLNLFYCIVGKLVRTLYNDKLPETAGQPSIRGRDVIAVPGWEDKTVYLFSINYNW